MRNREGIRFWDQFFEKESTNLKLMNLSNTSSSFLISSLLPMLSVSFCKVSQRNLSDDTQTLDINYCNKLNMICVLSYLRQLDYGYQYSLATIRSFSSSLFINETHHCILIQKPKLSVFALGVTWEHVNPHRKTKSHEKSPTKALLMYLAE